MVLMRPGRNGSFEVFLQFPPRGSERNMQGEKLRNFLEESAREGGKLALEHFGRVRAEPKGASIVSEADRAVERLLVSRIRAKFPADYILAEESGANGPAPPARTPGGGRSIPSTGR